MTYPVLNETNIFSITNFLHYAESVTNLFGVSIVLTFWCVVFFMFSYEPIDRRFTASCFLSAIVSFLFSALGVGNSSLGIILLVFAAIGYAVMKDTTLVS